MSNTVQENASLELVHALTALTMSYQNHSQLSTTKISILKQYLRVCCSVEVSNCNNCSPGTYAPWRAMPACLLCPAGTYSAIYGAPACAACMHGSYAAEPGAGACRLCPSGYTSSADGAVRSSTVCGFFDFLCVCVCAACVTAQT